MKPRQKYKSVMVVDDTHVDRFIAERNLKKYGYAEEVILCESAFSALSHLRDLERKNAPIPEQIFLDIRMPEMDGFGFLEEFKKFPEAFRKNIEVIMLSTSLNPIDHERAKHSRYVVRFVNKPLDRKVIEDLMGVSPVSDKVTSK